MLSVALYSVFNSCILLNTTEHFTHAEVVTFVHPLTSAKVVLALLYPKN